MTSPCSSSSGKTREMSGPEKMNPHSWPGGFQARRQKRIPLWLEKQNKSHMLHPWELWVCYFCIWEALKTQKTPSFVCLDFICFCLKLKMKPVSLIYTFRFCWLCDLFTRTKGGDTLFGTKVYLQVSVKEDFCTSYTQNTIGRRVLLQLLLCMPQMRNQLSGLSPEAKACWNLKLRVMKSQWCSGLQTQPLCPAEGTDSFFFTSCSTE